MGNLLPVDFLRRAKRFAARNIRKLSDQMRAADQKKSLVVFSKTNNPSISGPLFTVIIPTADRSGTLVDTIRTCLMQDDENLCVLVSDNASTDDTAKVVASFSDPRLKYINPGVRLGMAEHWEFALSHVKNGFVTVLGDDDGLLPDAVRIARRLIADCGAKVVTWQKIEYTWPDHIIPSFRNWLQIPLGTSFELLKARDVVAEVVGFRASYPKLPCIYNSFVSMELISAYREKNSGEFFGGMSPDVYSAFAIASQIEEFVFCQRPLSINGGSGKSNGTLQTLGNKDHPSAGKFWKETKFKHEDGLPQIAIIEFAVIDAFIKVKRSAPCFSDIEVDEEALLRSAVGSTFGGYIPAERREERIEAIREYAASRRLHSAFLKVYEQKRDTPPSSLELPKPGYHSPDNIVFDATTFGAHDVFAVSLRASEVLDLAAGQSELFKKLTQTKRPDLAVALFARAKGQPLRLHLGCGGAYFDGYVNVDFPQSEHAIMSVTPDVICDLTEIDLPADTVEEVRLQHVFEHLNRVVAIASVIRWHRWLRIGGRLHIETPDFEGSLRDFLNADDLQERMRAIRHLEGDQVNGWAYHVGQWFPERFKYTFNMLGFDEAEIRQEVSGHSPPLRNVVAIGTKTSSRSAKQQYQSGCDLLKQFMVAEEEGPTWKAWTKQLAGVLGGEILPQPSIYQPPLS